MISRAQRLTAFLLEGFGMLAVFFLLFGVPLISEGCGSLVHAYGQSQITKRGGQFFQTPNYPVTQMRIDGATPGQSLCIDPHGWVVGGTCGGSSYTLTLPKVLQLFPNGCAGSLNADGTCGGTTVTFKVAGTTLASQSVVNVKPGPNLQITPDSDGYTISAGQLKPLENIDAEGNSFVSGVGASAPEYAGANLVLADTPTVNDYNHGYGGATMSAIMNIALAKMHVSPRGPNVVIGNGVENDAFSQDTCGSAANTPCVVIFSAILDAFFGWATIPYQYRVRASNATMTGTWSADTTLPIFADPLLASYGTAMQTTSSGATATFTLTSTSATTHPGLTYYVSNGGTGTFTVTADGVAQMSPCGTLTWTSTGCSGHSLTASGPTTTAFRATFTVPAATTHTVVVTTTNSSLVEILAADLIPPANTNNANHLFFVDANSAWDTTGVYSAAVASLITTERANGMTVHLASIRAAGPCTYLPGLICGVNTTTDISLSPSFDSAGSTYGDHPNDVGYDHWRNTVEDAAVRDGYIFALRNGGGKSTANNGGFKVPLTVPALNYLAKHSLSYSNMNANGDFEAGMDFFAGGSFYPSVGIGGLYGVTGSGKPWSGSQIVHAYGACGHYFTVSRMTSPDVMGASNFTPHFGVEFCTGNTTSDGKYASNSTTGGFVAPLYTPASSATDCLAGTVADDASYHYVCTAGDGTTTGTWKRVALSTF